MRNRPMIATGATVSILTVAVMAALTALTAMGSTPDVTVPEDRETTALQDLGAERSIDLALCLDTSGSMTSLIDAARQKLWSIVNELALAEPTPRLRVALLTYGHDSYDPAQGWVKVDLELTDDLDAISERLFALQTGGGTEYVGRVVHTAVERLDWDPAQDALKLIVVAGNEEADQDPEVNNDRAAGDAIAQGIMINAIYCGNPTDAIAPGWQAVAKRADGHFASIDHNNGTVVVETPFDAQLASLSTQINDTYIPLGDIGRAGLANQSAQDANATSLNSAASASRAVTKSGKLFRKQWDLVDAISNGSVTWDQVETVDLPETMRDMTPAQQKAHVAAKQQQREEITAAVELLNAQRLTYIAEQSKKQGLDDSKSFDRAIRESVQTQAAAKGFRFEAENNEMDAAPEGP